MGSMKRGSPRDFDRQGRPEMTMHPAPTSSAGSPLRSCSTPEGRERRRRPTIATIDQCRRIFPRASRSGLSSAIPCIRECGSAWFMCWRYWRAAPPRQRFWRTFRTSSRKTSVRAAPEPLPSRAVNRRRSRTPPLLSEPTKSEPVSALPPRRFTRVTDQRYQTGIFRSVSSLCDQDSHIVLNLSDFARSLFH